MTEKDLTYWRNLADTGRCRILMSREQLGELVDEIDRLRARSRLWKRAAKHVWLMWRVATKSLVYGIRRQRHLEDALFGRCSFEVKP